MLSFNVIQCSYNMVRFSAFIEDLMVELRELNLVNKHIIMDNVAFHKNESIRRLIEDAGHLIYFLPP